MKSQLRHGNDLLAMDSLRECDVCAYCSFQLAFMKGRSCKKVAQINTVGSINCVYETLFIDSLILGKC